MTEEKRKFGDRKDGYRVRNLDSMHAISPLIMPRRCDNEAVMNEVMDITALNEYLAEKNASSPDFKYTFFHVILAAIAKTIVLRPRMNRFYAGGKLYDRKDIIFSFVVKKQFEDDAHEALAIIKIDRDSDLSPIEQIHSKIEKIVCQVRRENKKDGTTEIIDKLVSALPVPILRLVMNTLNWLNNIGHYPTSLMKDDPYFSTVFVSNLGSIKMHASYHHLANWGTNSLFVVVGEKKERLIIKDGKFKVCETIDLGMTVDERIADGVYFAKTVKILRHFIENPHLLDLPIDTEVEV